MLDENGNMVGSRPPKPKGSRGKKGSRRHATHDNFVKSEVASDTRSRKSELPPEVQKYVNLS